MFKKRVPLAVTWNITYRCNLRCPYCGVFKKEVKELDTKGVFGVIDELAKAGMRYIKFSGGEPLCREDLGEIIDYCGKKKIRVLLNSNGTLIKREFHKIKKVVEIQFCLEGPREVHDRIRGEGAHERLLGAVEMCRSNKIAVGFITVLSKHNISSLPYILSVAEKFKAGACFQPVTQDMSNGCEKGTLASLFPDPKDYRAAIDLLVGEKERGNRFVSQSLSGLKHLSRWPNPQKVNCLKHRICCFIEPDGKLFTCNMYPSYEKHLVPGSGGVRKAFDAVAFPSPCTECWSNDMELNLLGEFKTDAMLSLWERFSSQ